MNQEYPQVYELGLGSLIGDFFQNVKDTVTGVAKAVAPIAPYVLPFLPIPGIGGLSPALTKQLLGAGISLAAGQKPVDVAKNMALQAGIGGLKGAFMRPEGQTFAQGFKEGAFGIEPKISQSNISKAINYEAMPKNIQGTTLDLANQPKMNMGVNYSMTPTGSTALSTGPIDYPQAPTPTPSEKGFFSKIGSYLDPSQRTINPQYTKYKALNPELTDEQLLAMGIPKESGFIQQYGPLMYTGLIGASIADKFINPERDDTKSSYDLYMENPEDYGIYFAADGGPITGFAAGSGQKIKHPDGNVKEHPKRIGEIAGPGTGTSDDIPAMLSDGEFVMTAKAVRNAGGGSRKEGARNMYKLMKNLENGGRLSQQSMGMIGTR